MDLGNHGSQEKHQQNVQEHRSSLESHTGQVQAAWGSPRALSFGAESKIKPTCQVLSAARTVHSIRSNPRLPQGKPAHVMSDGSPKRNTDEPSKQMGDPVTDLSVCVSLNMCSISYPSVPLPQRSQQHEHHRRSGCTSEVDNAADLDAAGHRGTCPKNLVTAQRYQSRFLQVASILAGGTSPSRLST